MTQRWPLSALPWQQQTWSRVGQLAETDRLPHALLVAGAQGIGKAHFLRALAAWLLCESTSAERACGSCKSCTLLSAGSHADFMGVEVEEGSRVIKIDQVRELIEFAARTPSLGARKVILLGPAEVMNLNAANALLKCLEEPSANTSILLYSHQPGGLPATVRSRCQTLAMPAPGRPECIDWLAQVCGGAERASELLDAADGRPLEARQLYDSDGLERRRAIIGGLQGLLAGRLSPMAFPSLVADEELADVLEFMQRGLESHLRRSARPGDRRLQRGYLLRDELARLRRAVNRGANPNRQLIIEDCSARMATLLGVEET